MLDNNHNDDMSLDEVAASLLVNPNEKPVAKETVDNSEENTENAKATSDEVSDEAVNETSTDKETAEESAEDTEAENEEDLDADEFEIDVVVDGEEKKVKLKDLKANYSGNGAIEKRLQEASEVRNQALEHGKRLYVALNEEATRLAKLDEIIAKVAEPEINWEELKRTNLPKYLLERDRQREAQERREVVQREQARVKKEQERLQQLAQQEYAASEAKKLLTKLPEFADPVKAQEKFAKLSKAGQVYGYTAEEVSAVLDHRAMLVLNDALKYQEMIANQNKTNKKTAPSTTLLRPGSSKAVQPVNQAKKLKEALVKKARSTGKVDDVAATLLIRKK